MRKAPFYGMVWGASFSFPASWVAWEWCQEKGTGLFYHILLFPVGLIIRDWSDIPFLMTLAIAAILYSFAGLGVGLSLGQARTLRDESPFWTRHRYEVSLTPLAGPLWLLVILLGEALYILLMHLLFLPYTCLVWAWYPSIPAWVNALGLLILVPGQYLAIGMIIDKLRRTTKPGRRARALVLCAACTLALVLYFAVWADPHDPDSIFPSRGELATIVGAYGLGIGALLWLALRTWLRPAAQDDPTLTG